MMLTKHSWKADVHIAALTAYCAKKNAEIAPGVGTHTDMFIVGPDLGSYDRIRVDIVAKLDDEYQKLKTTQAEAQAAAEQELKRYVDLTSSSATSQADKPSPEPKKDAPPKPPETKLIEGKGPKENDGTTEAS
jgi:hypothetical protein